MGIWGGDSNLGVERGLWGWWRGGSGGRWRFGWWRLMWRVMERGIWGWGSLPISPSKESAGSGWGIGITGEPRHCGEGDLEGGDLCLFRQAWRVLGESGGGIGITGEPARCSVSVFFS